MTEHREQAIIRCALVYFIADAYTQMNAAAQDKDNRRYKPGDVDAFFKDAKDAEALLEKLRINQNQEQKG